MSKRVTIVIDDDTNKKVLSHQVKQINESSSSYSFSKALNDVLRASSGY